MCLIVVYKNPTMHKGTNATIDAKKSIVMTIGLFTFTLMMITIINAVDHKGHNDDPHWVQNIIQVLLIQGCYTKTPCYKKQSRDRAYQETALITSKVYISKSRKRSQHCNDTKSFYHEDTRLNLSSVIPCWHFIIPNGRTAQAVESA